MEKNECAKTRKQDNPYEIWKNAAGWTWKVLKKYQREGLESENVYARWFCFVTSPVCPYGELGDVYVKEIREQATKQPA